MATSNKRVAYQILRFLQDSVKDGSIRSDDAEGIEVASQCISEAFGVELDKPSDKDAFSIEPETLTTVLEKHAATAKSAAPTPLASTSSAPPKAALASPEQIAKAEKSKGTGNQLMASKDYNGAIKAYGDAIALDGNNAVYWSNRAAAYSQIQQHASAVSDARQALVVDPKFSKAYSRLGHALFSSGQYQEAVDAYEQGLELDPSNPTMKSSLATARSRVPKADAEPEDDDTDEEDASPAVTSRGAGGAGGFPGAGAGGMPDLASMMQNPAIMNMAQQMMQNGGLEQLMNNPMLRQMMGGAGGAGGGMPDINALMQDPTMRAMAEQFGSAMGGAGGAGGVGGAGAAGRRPGSGQGGSNSNNDSMYS